jgi:hypothetical protein
VFELGLFTGALGRQGTLIVKRKGDELRIPSDLLEVTALECTTGKPITLNTRIAPVCHAVRKRGRGTWSKVKESANMGLAHDLKDEVDSIIKSRWSMRNSSVVPETENVQLGNDAVLLDGAVLYADLAGSTKLVKEKEAGFAAKIYKSYLICACNPLWD